MGHEGVAVGKNMERRRSGSTVGGREVERMVRRRGDTF